MPAKQIVRNHSSHGAFDQQFRMASAACPDILRFVAADVPGKTHVTFLFLFFSGEWDFFRVNADPKISSSNIWREIPLSFAPRQVGGFTRAPPEHRALGVDYPPLG